MGRSAYLAETFDSKGKRIVLEAFAGGRLVTLRVGSTKAVLDADMAEVLADALDGFLAEAPDEGT